MNKRKLSKVEIQLYDARDIQWGITKKIDKGMVIRVQAKKVEGRAILILNFYKAADLKNPNKELVKPEYRVFLSRADWEFATQDLTKTKQNWTGMTVNDIWYKEYKYQGAELDRNIDEKLLKHYFGFTYGPNWKKYIDSFQKSVKQKRRLHKNKSWISAAEKKMSEVPRKLPEDFGKWIQRDVLYRSRYIYYQYDKAKKGIGQQGYCTHCKNNVLIDGATHRKKGICPICKSRIMYLCESKAGYITDEIGASIIQKCSSGLVLRCFGVQKKYYPDFRHPSLRVVENERIFLGDKIEHYAYRMWEETKDCRWREAGYWRNGMGVLYTKNLGEMLEKTKWQYSGLYEYASFERGKEIHAPSYLEKYVKTPRMEHIVKMGMTHLMDDYVNRKCCCIDFSKESIFQTLGLSKQDTRYIQEINGGSEVLNAIKSLRKKEIKFTYEQFEEAWSTFGDCFDDFQKVLNYGTIGKILKYLKQQVRGRAREKYKNILKDWIDYIGMGTRLGYNFENDFVLFPNNLKERHNAAAFLIQEREQEKRVQEKRKENSIINRMYQDLSKKFGFETKNLMIVFPESAEDIVKEGQNMHHCVGSYVKRVVEGKTAILFIRKKDEPNEPFFTMEVRNNRVEQCRGKYNCAMTDEVRSFVEQFKKKCLREKKNRKQRRRNK